MLKKSPRISQKRKVIPKINLAKLNRYQNKTTKKRMHNNGFSVMVSARPNVPKLNTKFEYRIRSVRAEINPHRHIAI